MQDAYLYGFFDELTKIAEDKKDRSGLAAGIGGALGVTAPLATTVGKFMEDRRIAEGQVKGYRDFFKKEIPIIRNQLRDIKGLMAKAKDPLVVKRLKRLLSESRSTYGDSIKKLTKFMGEAKKDVVSHTGLRNFLKGNKRSILTSLALGGLGAGVGYGAYKAQKALEKKV